MSLNRPSQEKGDKLRDIALDQPSDSGIALGDEVQHSHEESESSQNEGSPADPSARFTPRSSQDISNRVQSNTGSSPDNSASSGKNNSRCEDAAGSSSEPPSTAAFPPSQLRQPYPNASSVATNTNQLLRDAIAVTNDGSGTQLGHSRTSEIQISTGSHHDQMIHYNSSEGASTSRPRLSNLENLNHSQYITVDNRMSTFHDWPSDHPIIPWDIALAGMYYLGIGDECKCPFCGGSLRDWGSTDDPLVEHARWFPQCEFVKQVMGTRFVDAVQELAMNSRNITRGQVEERLNRSGIREQSSSQVHTLPGEALALYCRVCGVRRVRIVFLPCCHLICCIQCSEWLTGCSVGQDRCSTNGAVCPECNQVIEGLKMVAIRSRIEYPRRS